MTLLDLCALTCIGWHGAGNALDKVHFDTETGYVLLAASRAAYGWLR